MNSIGERAKQARAMRGLSQSELARRMQSAGWPNYYQVTVSRTEQDERPVRLDEAVDLSTILGVTLQWLASGLGNAENDFHQGYRVGIQDARDALTKL